MSDNNWKRIHIYAPHSSSISIDSSLLQKVEEKLGSWSAVRRVINAETKKPLPVKMTRSRQVSKALLGVL